MVNKNEFVPLPIESVSKEQELKEITIPIMRVKKEGIEVEIFSGIDRYMFFHLMKEWLLDVR